MMPAYVPTRKPATICALPRTVIACGRDIGQSQRRSRHEVCGSHAELKLDRHDCLYFACPRATPATARGRQGDRDGLLALLAIERGSAVRRRNLRSEEARHLWSSAS